MHAYVTNQGDKTVSVYRIEGDGALTPVPGSPFPGGFDPAGVAVDILGRVAYVVNNPGPGSISAFHIKKDGALTPIAGSPFPAGANPTSIAVDVLGRFVYATNFADGTISAYRIGLYGALTQLASSPFPAAGAAPIFIAVDLLGRFAYEADFGGGFGGGIGGGVSAYRIGADGGLTPIAGSPFAAGVDPRCVALDPLCRFAYVANVNASFQPNANNVSAYSIGPDGALTPVTGSPFPSGTEPISVAVDFFGRFAYVTNAGDNTVSGFQIGLDGSLNPVPGSPFPSGNAPSFITISH